MLARSVPCYKQVIAMTADLLRGLLRNGDHVYDLGCSTGNTLLELSRRLDATELFFTGVDNSAAMLTKAARKAEMYSTGNRINFIEADITKLELADAGAVILNYTAQFIRPPLRPDFLKRVHSFLRPGGLLIMSEKILSHDAALNRTYIDLYHAFKREQGYSEIEISKKREALENVLIPFTIAENRKMLEGAGFSSAETFFQWFNFASFVAAK
jgi:tRNA (cmo5U34)-methyltransferase